MSTIKNPNITQFNGVIEGTPSDQPENTYRPVANVTISGDYSAFKQDARIKYFVLALIASNILVYFLSNYLSLP